jgi:hypothetical protein
LLTGASPGKSASGHFDSARQNFLGALFVFKTQFDNESACFCLPRIHREMAEHQQFCAYFQNCAAAVAGAI